MAHLLAVLKYTVFSLDLFFFSCHREFIVCVGGGGTSRQRKYLGLADTLRKRAWPEMETDV